MAISVVIGAATTASFGGGNLCIISAQWGFNPGRADAFCLGEWLPSADHVVYKPTQTLSLTMYAPSPVVTIPPTTSCTDAETISASVSPATCGTGTDSDLSGNWFVQSFSYSKESKDAAAQESWSLIKYKDLNSLLPGVDPLRIAYPTYVMRGITMGEATDSAQAGITFSSTFALASTGSVSAGSFGKISTVIHGTVSAVGGGTKDAGFAGNGSASIPYTPLYI